MASLIDALGVSLTGLSQPPSTALSAQDNLSLLVGLTGSGRAAARYLGVAESTLRGWRKGVRPKIGTKAIVVAARRLAAAQAGTLGPARTGTGSLAITATVTVSSDSRRRTVYPGRHIPLSTIRRVLTRWSAADDDDRVERSLYRAIDTYYQPLMFTTIDEVWWE